LMKGKNLFGLRSRVGIAHHRPHAAMDDACHPDYPCRAAQVPAPQMTPRVQSMSKEPHPLNYATRIGVYPSPKRHPAIVVCIIGLTALAGVWAIILGIFFSIDWPACAVPLAVGGLGLCWATLGHLSAAHIRLRPALLLLTIAVAFEARATFVANRAYQPRLAHYAAGLRESPSDYRAPMTSAERQVLPYQMLRNAAGAATLLGTTSWLYVGVWLAARRGHEV
jgi:hypothetical protein